MTTADRVDREIHRAWSRAVAPAWLTARPLADVRTDAYIGRHRRPTRRRFSARALFYFARHRR